MVDPWPSWLHVIVTTLCQARKVFDKFEMGFWEILDFGKSTPYVVDNTVFDFDI